MHLSILDVLPVLSGSSATDAIDRAVPLARLADRRGFERVWYAEHHGMAGIASSSPELMIAHVAPKTERVRVGAGGVMLPNHTPLQVVERYRTLEALHPGRIDLGIGRAAGTDPLTARALRSVSGDRVSHLIAELLSFTDGSFPDDHPFRNVRVTPENVDLPPIWMLGSSGGSARLAGDIGAGYAFAGHFSATPAAPAIEAYRSAFEPSEAFPEPRVMLALSVICADTQSEARELSSSIEILFQRLRTGETGPVPSPAEAREAGWAPDVRTHGPMADLLIAGTPGDVRGRIVDAAAKAGAEEVMVMTIVHDAEARFRSYELLADAFDLESRNVT
ncbi:MAG: LLM class flavin-dependent oxidoreductase [Rhodothermales bacterium]